MEILIRLLYPRSNLALHKRFSHKESLFLQMKKKKEFRLKSFHLSEPRNVVEMVVLSVKHSIKNIARRRKNNHISLKFGTCDKTKKTAQLE